MVLDSGRVRHRDPRRRPSENLVVLDFDTFPAFMQWGWASLDDAERAALAGSPVIRTPKGGRHVYVRAVEPIKGCKLARTRTGETP